MTILFLGNFRESFCSESHYKKTLEKMGHTVIQMQESEVTGKDLVRQMDKHKIDYFFWVHTHNWVTPELDGALAYFGINNIPSFGYHLDLYMGLEREPRINDYITKLDYFFTVDKLMADWLNENTITKGFYLPAGVFEDECYMAEPDYNRFPHEIIFTGSKGYHKEYPYRQQLIDWLHRTYGDRFAHYGGGGKPVMRGHDLNVLYASAKIVVGDTLCIDFKYPFYFSDRLFEVPGRGGFMIFPDIKGVEIMYGVLTEMPIYQLGNFDDLQRKIEYYISNDEVRELIRHGAHKRVLSAHTYTHRLKQLLETLEKEKATI